MKRLKKKHQLILIVIACILVSYLGLRYYLKPGWFDWGNTYYPVYNYKVKHIQPKKKVIKDLNIEFVHKENEELLQGQEWTEGILSNWDEYNEQQILHVTFTDGSKSDIPLREPIGIGPSFSNNLLNDSIYQKLSFRFPEFKSPNIKETRKVIDRLLFLYAGDTLYQVPEASSEISYQLKNPKTGEMQTYYEYGNKPDFSWTPIFFTSSKEPSDNELDFFEDYQKRSRGNYWDRYYHNLYNNRLTHKSHRSYSRIFYSDDLTNLPLSVSTTGSQFKMTITHSYIVERIDNKDYKVKSTSKTYTDKNKAEYITEVLNQI
ncbi:hypothetical protein [Streptococcus cristatus]|uniref:Uncharacterized protein n=1 Tax=Streptococcus cristatus TaxID=45634 RepID=A0A3R9M519_STRCR|nr:hypothetical protein [Streptococcus cristatus]RSJ94940.1 hypothetical protein D8790_06645 [Streptococcus cristatus]